MRGPAMRAWRLAAVALWLGACGYRFVDEREVFGPEVATIEVRAFGNRSAEPGYERMLADSIGEEFSRRGVLRPLWSEGAGDLVMDGRIGEVGVFGTAFSSAGIAVEQRVEVLLDAHVRERAGGEEVWRVRRARFSERFLSSPDPQVYESNKEQALRRLSARIAERIHDGLFRGF